MIVKSKANQYFCRICWNTNSWQKPSGPPKDLGNSGDFGYGYDEWLRRFEWMTGKHHYAFLEPFHIPTKGGRENVGPGDYDLILYTINPETKKRFLVGRINPCSKLDETEMEEAQGLCKKNGWFKVMQREAKSFARSIYPPPPSISVRFKPSDMQFCINLVLLPKGHFLYSHRFDRYAPREPKPTQWQDAVRRIRMFAKQVQRVNHSR